MAARMSGFNECDRCKRTIRSGQNRIYAGGAVWHPKCFAEQYPDVVAKAKPKRPSQATYERKVNKALLAEAERRGLCGKVGHPALCVCDKKRRRRHDR